MPTTSTSIQDLLQRGVLRTVNLTELQSFGQSLGARLPAHSLLALHGELGAGKTTLARAICAGAGVKDLSAVTSPTFAIVHEYPTSAGIVVHADLYRLKSVNELLSIGWDDLIDRAQVMLVEWPERAGDTLPSNTVHVELGHVASDHLVRSLMVR